MISVNEALGLIDSNINCLEPINVSLEEAIGTVSSENIYSSINFPPFNQSAMDGYGISFQEGVESYELIGESKAGDDASIFNLQPGQCIRIFTGAMVPSSVDRVVRQEDVKLEEKLFVNIMPNEGANIRIEGEQVQKEDLILKKGTKINSGIVGFLAMIGIEKINVIRKPNVHLIITGNELIPIDEKLSPGKIYESNSHLLEAMLKEIGLELSIFRVKDNLQETINAIESSLRSSDLLLLSGGVSVGDYDFVPKALELNGVDKVFHKLKQKPGKPLFFGKRENTAIFGLPGNPASVYSCFKIFVEYALNRMVNQPSLNRYSSAKLKSSFSRKPGLTQFLKGKLDAGIVEVCDGQSSAMLKAFVDANCLIMIPEEISELKEGEFVKIIPLN